MLKKPVGESGIQHQKSKLVSLFYRDGRAVLHAEEQKRM